MKITRNLFGKDPLFAITYDIYAERGSSRKPRVTEPGGRSFTLAVETEF